MIKKIPEVFLRNLNIQTNNVAIKAYQILIILLHVKR